MFSTQHCLLLLIENFRKGLDKGDFSGIVMTNLLKPFDCIDHQSSNAKINACGFNIESVKFINSYLYGRKQRVKINSSLSQWCDVTSGVP